jgi:hypothetical protein
MASPVHPNFGFQFHFHIYVAFPHFIFWFFFFFLFTEVLFHHFVLSYFPLVSFFFYFTLSFKAPTQDQSVYSKIDPHMRDINGILQFRHIFLSSATYLWVPFDLLFFLGVRSSYSISFDFQFSSNTNPFVTGNTQNQSDSGHGSACLHSSFVCLSALDSLRYSCI